MALGLTDGQMLGIAAVVFLLGFLLFKSAPRIEDRSDIAAGLVLMFGVQVMLAAVQLVWYVTRNG